MRPCFHHVFVFSVFGRVPGWSFSEFWFRFRLSPRTTAVLLIFVCFLDYLFLLFCVPCFVICLLLYCLSVSVWLLFCLSVLPVLLLPWSFCSCFPCRLVLCFVCVVLLFCLPSVFLAGRCFCSSRPLASVFPTFLLFPLSAFFCLFLFPVFLVLLFLLSLPVGFVCSVCAMSFFWFPFLPVIGSVRILLSSFLLVALFLFLLSFSFFFSLCGSLSSVLSCFLFSCLVVSACPVLLPVLLPLTALFPDVSFLFLLPFPTFPFLIPLFLFTYARGGCCHGWWPFPFQSYRIPSRQVISRFGFGIRGCH